MQSENVLLFYGHQSFEHLRMHLRKPYPSRRTCLGMCYE